MDVIARRTGLQIFVNGRPVELLHRSGGSETAQEWRVKPLFVEGPEFDMTIRSTDVCTKLHTQYAR